MKRLLAALSLMAGVAIAGSLSVSVVGTVKVLPMVGYSITSTVWEADTAYSQGQYVYASPEWFMCLVAGTSGSAAATSKPGLTPSGVFTDTNGVTSWYRVMRQSRSALVIQDTVGTNISLMLGHTNVNAGATVIEPRGGISLPIGGEECWQGEVYGNSTGATAKVQEW